MSKFIILILALLAVSTFGFRMRDDTPPGPPGTSGPPAGDGWPTEAEADAFWVAFDACWEDNCSDEECSAGFDDALECCENLEWFGKSFISVFYEA